MPLALLPSAYQSNGRTRGALPRFPLTIRQPVLPLRTSRAAPSAAPMTVLTSAGNSSPPIVQHGTVGSRRRPPRSVLACPASGMRVRPQSRCPTRTERLGRRGSPTLSRRGPCALRWGNCAGPALHASSEGCHQKQAVARVAPSALQKAGFSTRVRNAAGTVSESPGQRPTPLPPASVSGRFQRPGRLLITHGQSWVHPSGRHWCLASRPGRLACYPLYLCVPCRALTSASTSQLRPKLSPETQRARTGEPVRAL
jgi:hypothetical protein